MLRNRGKRSKLSQAAHDNSVFSFDDDDDDNNTAAHTSDAGGDAGALSSSPCDDDEYDVCVEIDVASPDAPRARRGRAATRKAAPQQRLTRGRLKPWFGVSRQASARPTVSEDASESSDEFDFLAQQPPPQAVPKHMLDGSVTKVHPRAAHSKKPRTSSPKLWLDDDDDDDSSASADAAHDNDSNAGDVDDSDFFERRQVQLTRALTKAADEGVSTKPHTTPRRKRRWLSSACVVGGNNTPVHVATPEPTPSMMASSIVNGSLSKAKRKLAVAEMVKQKAIWDEIDNDEELEEELVA
eukprot:TRINITY_DN5481_c0_g1_i1.p1 TRINITY_DN5481_c0_g1~~TRINITY_DN5481_c0_g1_i1.p1  ORF type:complete len:297 (+),score=114.23 TRINITY_DN5481_c0_g1_i1:1065-1955(+)